MTLQDFTTTETSTLILQLLTTRSDALRQQLRAVQDALGELERAAAAPLEMDEAVQELSGRLNGAFGTIVERVRKEGRAAVANIERELDAERGAKSALEESVAALESEISLLRTELADARASVDASISRIAELGCERDEERAENQALKNALAAARETEDRLDAERLRAEHALARHEETAARVELQLGELRGSLDEALADAARLGAQLEASVADKGRLAIELSAARGELQMAQAQRDAVAAQLKASLARAHMLNGRQAEAAPPPARPPEPVLAPAGGSGRDAGEAAVIEASIRSVEELTRASSLADLLSGLSNQLSREFSRVALFRVQGNRLQGEHQVGFDYTTEIRKIAIPLNVDSMLTRVVATREMERLSSEDLADDSKGAPFRGKPTVALALPVVLRGEAIAVVYLDNWDQTASAARRNPGDDSILFSQLVVRQSAVLFIGLAHEMRVLEELREYAATLLKGAEQMYGADLEARMKEDVLRARLEDNLACARQLFANRAAHEGPAAAALLDEQIEAAIEADPSAPFARDLAAIRVREHEAHRSAAEAC